MCLPATLVLLTFVVRAVAGHPTALTARAVQPSDATERTRYGLAGALAGTTDPAAAMSATGDGTQESALPSPLARQPRRRILRQAEPLSDELTVLLPGSVPLVMVRIHGGTPFLMGAPHDQRGSTSYERPQHLVTISEDYYLGKLEVTQAQWHAVMGGNPSHFSDCGATCPVEQVSWDDIAGAGGFLDRLNGAHGATVYRLPTEAEWEYAARAGTDARFSYGDALECGDECESCGTHARNMWWCGNAGSTHPGGEKPPNPWGLFDMHGNVWEWVSDWYGTYVSAPQTDPQGRVTGKRRIVRGGSWSADASHCRSTRRFYSAPIYRYDSVGFRLARSR